MKKNYSTPTIHNVAVIPGHSMYLVYDDGRVFSIKSGKFLKPVDRGNRHLNVNLDGENIFVHRLVAQAFIPNPNGYDCVHHLNGDPTDNRVENLVWISRAEHQRIHARVSMIGNTNGAKPVMRMSDGAIFPSASAASRAIGKCENAVRASIFQRTRCDGSYWCYVETDDDDIWEDDPNYEGHNIFEEEMNDD